MRKLFSFDKRSTTVFCSHSKCAMVRGAEGVSRAPIKENVVARHAEGKPHVCYDCAIYLKTGKTRHQRKEAKAHRKASRAQAAQEAMLRVKAANA